MERRATLALKNQTENEYVLKEILSCNGKKNMNAAFSFQLRQFQFWVLQLYHGSFDELHVSAQARAHSFTFSTADRARKKRRRSFEQMGLRISAVIVLYTKYEL